ncbi:restriction endonuclease subunit S [Haemophilus paraphrohaemolyticus]|uniref:Type I restriction modification DNA specificity domain protein n=1 Tax=Haemophilus paraphrohaemolyticus HK411 TaxID=1095743 RepID=I2NLZ3_9PAST|nr:restriction endonuclease subunit S [Haemophilus paraphrohaemolyticus]EIG26854.1 type I restriction modification DNA specificity domain protein [Haemophilus paraphrohaemolyticus HK411]OOR95497.1 restriction endonuclease subunit S [Haemophilus paraphrohaemolyticus]STP00621.1 EcoKI restriction-modification system protein HsdS [Haemophilus paraphrohaemolyticus]
MRRYESYKDSGVEWLGKIPSQWELTIGMNVFRENKRDNKGMKEKTVLSLSYGQIIIKPEEKLVGLVPESFETYQIVEPNDIIIRCTDLQNDKTSLRTGLAKDKGIITSAYLNLKVINNHSAKFLHYYLHTLDITKVLYKFGSGLRQNLSFLDFKRLPIIDIPLSEQQKIAQFLDEKTAKIDQAVDLAEKQIALLKEHKQILIQNAVIRGLNPDVPLKDSGVEWIGQVPEHWEVKKLKYLAKLSPSKSEITCNHEESCSFIPMEKLKLNTLVLDEIKQIKNVYSAYTYFRDEDLLIAKVTPCFENKNFAIAKNLVNSIGFGSSEIYVLRTYNNLLNKFLFYRLQEQNFMEIAISKMSGTGGLKRVPSEFINNFQLALPPFCEQQKIADYLDKQTAKIDQAIALKTAHIEKLKEYKSVLINDVVTGKVRVSV